MYYRGSKKLVHRKNHFLDCRRGEDYTYIILYMFLSTKISSTNLFVNSTKMELQLFSNIYQYILCVCHSQEGKRTIIRPKRINIVEVSHHKNIFRKFHCKGKIHSNQIFDILIRYLGELTRV